MFQFFGGAASSPAVSSARRGRAAIPFFLLTVLLLSAVFLRFYKLDEKGLSGSDSVYYTTIAEAWSQGNISYQVGSSTRVYRPVVFAFFAAAFTIFGHNDSAIKRMNASVDTINIGLVFLICYLLAPRNVWPAFASALLYAFLPLALFFARIELVHVTSGLMVLLSVLFFILACQTPPTWKSKLFFSLSGVFVGCAALTHEELLFLIPGFLAFLFVNLTLGSYSPTPIKTFVLDSILFLVSALGVCINLFLVHQDLVSRQATAVFAGPRAQGVPFFDRVLAYFERGSRYLWDALMANSSVVLAAFFLPILFFVVLRLVYRLWQRRLGPSSLSVPYILPILVLAYFACYAYFIPNFYFIRLFLPLMPLVLISFVVWYFHFFQRLWKMGANVVVVLIAFGMLALNFDNFKNYWMFRTKSFTTTWASPALSFELDLVESYRQFVASQYTPSPERTIYEALKGKIHTGAKLLITSSITYPYPGRRVLQVGYYFGDNAIYMIDHIEPLDEVITKYHIKYILFTTLRADQRFLRNKFYQKYEYDGQWTRAPLQLGASYGFAPGEYSLQKEYEALIEYLQTRNASLILVNGSPAGMDAIPPDTPPSHAGVVYELGS